MDFRVDEPSNPDVDGLQFRDWLRFKEGENKRISLENLQRMGGGLNPRYQSPGYIAGKSCRIKIQQSDYKPENSEVKSIYQQYVPEGTYTCKIGRVGDIRTVAKVGGGESKPFFSVDFVIESGEYEGLAITERLYVNEKSLGVTAAKLGAMGVPVGDFDTDNERDRKSMIGLRANITLQDRRQSDGSTQTKLTKISKLGRKGASAPAESAPTPSAAAQPDASGSVNVNPGQVAGASDEEDEDDIPF